MFGRLVDWMDCVYKYWVGVFHSLYVVFDSGVVWYENGILFSITQSAYGIQFNTITGSVLIVWQHYNSRLVWAGLDWFSWCI